MISSGRRKYLSVTSRLLDSRRRTYPLADSSEHGGIQGDSLGFGELGDDIVLHLNGRGRRRLLLFRVKPQELVPVLQHLQRRLKVFLRHRLLEHEVAAVDRPLHQDLAVPHGVLGDDHIGPVHVGVAVREADSPPGVLGVLVDLLDRGPLQAKEDDSANPLADFGFGGFGHGASGVGDDAE
jgi:hypothetical protein